MRSFFACIGFLTVIPLPGGLRGGERELAGAVKWFPVAGALIGLLAVGFDLLVRVVFAGPFVPGVLTVLALIAISGGLHMDGLADTADAFLSARKRERMLEIMKDSRVGVMGVLAIAAVLFVKVAAVMALPADLRAATLFLTPLAGRTALMLHMASLSYARAEGGLGKLFCANKIVGGSGVAVLLVAAALLLGPARGTVAVLIITGVVFLFNERCKRNVGGYTGDTLGAVCELCECAMLLIGASCLTA